MAYIRKRETGRNDKFGNAVVTYQVVWREPVRDEFGALTGKTKQTSETFPAERKAKAHQRKVENDLDSAAGVSRCSPVGAIAMSSIGRSQCARRAYTSTTSGLLARHWDSAASVSTTCGTPSRP